MMSKAAAATARLIFVLSSALLVGPCVYMVLDDQHPTIYTNGVIVPDPASGGDQVEVQFDIVTNRICPGSVQRVLIDSRGLAHLYDRVKASKLVMDQTGLEKSFTLPIVMPAGKTIYRATLEFYCNPLQYLWPITYATPEIVFNINKSDPLVGPAGPQGIQGERGIKGETGANGKYN